MRKRQNELRREVYMNYEKAPRIPMKLNHVIPVEKCNGV